MKIVIEVISVTQVVGSLLAISMLPRVTRQLCSDAQAKAHYSEQYDIRKVSPHDVVSQGVRKQRGRRGRRDHALHRNDRLCESVRGA
jgi:hypothetical protein